MKMIGILFTLSAFGLKSPKWSDFCISSPTPIQSTENGRNFHFINASILEVKAMKMVSFLHFIHHIIKRFENGQVFHFIHPLLFWIKCTENGWNFVFYPPPPFSIKDIQNGLIYCVLSIPLLD